MLLHHQSFTLLHLLVVFATVFSKCLPSLDGFFCSFHHHFRFNC